MKNIFEKIKSVFNLSIVDSIYKLLIFGDLTRVCFPFLMKKYIATTRKKQDKHIEQLKLKQEIVVAFFMQTPSVWKYHNVYLALKKDSRFKPIVVVCPYNVHLNYSKPETLKIMKQTEQFAIDRGYEYILSYSYSTKKWIDIKKVLNPDIVFFTKPYKDTVPECYIYRFREKLTCYTPYGFGFIKSLVTLNSNLPLHNLLSYFFVDNWYQKEMIGKNSLVGNKNVVVTHSLSCENILDKSYVATYRWKAQDTEKKRIIWAPHHTIDYLFNFSNFLTYCELMPHLAKKYENRVQFAFKPHPVLKFKLINIWGEEKTEKYYNHWATMHNTQLEQGDYIDLFLSSDAIIHDCVSFTVEYLHTCKPALFLVRDRNITNEWDSFGLKAFELHHKAYCSEDIENFIENVVIDQNDTKANDRKVFFDEYLFPKDGVMPSKKIYETLKNSIK